MTESEWLSSTDAVAMVEFVQNATTSFRTRWQGIVETRRFALSDRKMRLLGCAIASGVAHLLPEGPFRTFLDLVESWAERHATREQVVEALPTDRQCDHIRPDESIRADPRQEPAREAVEEAIFCLHPEMNTLSGVMRSSIVAVALTCSPQDESTLRRIPAESARQANLTRCILGNPFAPPRLDPDWLAAHPVLAQIARSIYDDRAFRELPILADALEDAGCDQADLLAHCRSIEPHARGCWVVDLVLGKQ